MSVEKIRGLLNAGLGETGPALPVLSAPAAPSGMPSPLLQSPAPLLSPLSGPPPGLARRSRWSVPIGATIVIILVALAGAVAVSALTPQGATATVGADAAAVSPNDGATGALGAGDGIAANAASPGGVPIFVHILGAVSAPGLYELRDGDRAVDAVAAAGGFAAEADLSQLNLARFVSDGEQIVVPIVGAAPPAASSGLTSEGKVNINTADATTLETLPRVGPAMSARIIAWPASARKRSMVSKNSSRSKPGDS
jgi:competence protein ComEA